ncbi:MAG TPA: lipo-like protein, partial [Gammaproteobacteria bacterium]|nr:lipo-like protein [Gammaproteobacteria bacterium]
LLRFLIQKPAVPNRFRRAMINIGSGEPTKAICSTLIAQSFQSINYPILPLRDEGVGGEGEVPHFYKRHFTHFTPRDFDLSPYFRIVKPTLEKNFDFHNLHWQEEQKGTEA